MTQSFVAEPQGTGEIVKYQQTGKQTQFTPEILQLASKIQGTPLDKTKQILTILKSLRVTQFDESVFRKRTAGQTLKGSFVTGCTDSDLVFVALARASELSVKYVETIDESWLKKEEIQFKAINMQKFMTGNKINGFGLTQWEIELIFHHLQMMGG